MKSLSIGRLFGVKLELHVVFIAFFAILVGFELHNGHAAALNRFFELTCVYSFIIIHEFGHISAARSLGIRTSRIVLYPFGGVAFLERFPDGPWKQIYIAIAGPMTNFVIFALLFPFIDLNNEHPRWNDDPLVFIAMINAILGIFNLIPAFPMDGGRILKGFMQLSIGKRFANTASLIVGQSVGIVFAGMAVYAGSPMLFLVGLFVFFAAPLEFGKHPFWFAGYPRNGKDALPRPNDL